MIKRVIKMNSTAIDCLPPEMIVKILRNLNLDDLINCKLVSKQWYSIIFDLVKLSKLVLISGDRNKFKRIRWYHSNALTDNDLEHCKLSSFLTHFNKNILSNLNQLNINVKLPSTFDLNQVNLFTKLIHLEIHCNLKAGNLNLNLSNLEVLYCGNSRNSDAHLSIECPKLKIFSYFESYDVDLLSIKYPESVKDLQSEFIGEKLARFKNVENLTFSCSSFNFNATVNETTLRNLRNLKKITHNEDINNFLCSFNYRTTFDAIARIKLALRSFFNSAKKLKMPDLKLTVSGLQLTENNIDLIDFDAIKIQQDCASNENFYAINYKYLVDCLSFIHWVNYDHLMLTGQVPKDYFVKFSNIRRITAGGDSAGCDPIDQEHFLWFLKNLDYLKELEIFGTNLTQSFFDELPTFCSLNHFLYCSENPELNFDFIAKFINLDWLSIEENLNLKSVTSLIKAIENLKYLDLLDIYFMDKFYPIQRTPADRDRYDLLIRNDDRKEEPRIKNLNLDRLIEYFEIESLMNSE